MFLQFKKTKDAPDIPISKLINGYRRDISSQCLFPFILQLLVANNNLFIIYLSALNNYCSFAVAHDEHLKTAPLRIII